MEAANFSADWLLNLAQIFGLPFRWANYDPSAPQETVDRICTMLQNMGSAGWAAFPTGTTLELRAEGQKSGAQTPQGDMLDRADKQCDLLVLGQTLTTDTGGMGSGGGSHALGQVHADVRSGIIDAAAKFAAGVIEQQLIPAILRLNYGDAEEAPTLHLQTVTADNLQEKAAILAQLTAAGAGSIIPLDWLGKTFGIPKPKAGEATLADATESTDLERLAALSTQNAVLMDEALQAGPWNSFLHPRDLIGRFIPKWSGSAGPQGPTSGSTDADNSSKSADAAAKPTPSPIDKRPIDPGTHQRIVSRGFPTDSKILYLTVKAAALAVAKIIASQNHTRYEYGAAIYRKIGPNNTKGGYYYGPIEEGPEPPSMQQMLSGRKTRMVNIPFLGSEYDHDLAGTMHSHPFDVGTKQDIDHQKQLDLMAGKKSDNAPGGAFSYFRKDGDIENSIADQSRADSNNPLPSDDPQEHYLMTAGKQIWVYKPERPVVGEFNVQPERALQPKLFQYVGHL